MFGGTLAKSICTRQQQQNKRNRQFVAIESSARHQAIVLLGDSRLVPFIFVEKPSTTPASFMILSMLFSCRMMTMLLVDTMKCQLYIENMLILVSDSHSNALVFLLSCREHTAHQSHRQAKHYDFSLRPKESQCKNNAARHNQNE